MAENYDATPTPASEPSAFDLAEAQTAETPYPSYDSEFEAYGDEAPSAGAADWSFDAYAPMTPGERLLEEAATLSPEARAELDRYVKGSQELYGKHYLRGLQELEPDDDPYEPYDPYDPVDEYDPYESEYAYDPGDGYDSIDPYDPFDPYEGDDLNDPEFDPEDPEQVEEDREWLRSRGIDPDEVAWFRENQEQIAEVLAEREEAQMHAQADAWVQQYAPAVLMQAGQETGGWNPGPEALKNALLRAVQMPEGLRPTTYGELLMSADPTGYKAWVDSRRYPGPEMGGGDASSAMQATPLETGTGSVFDAAARAVGLRR